MIENLVTYEESHQTLIDVYHSSVLKDLDPSYWNKDEVTPVRTAIKQHYIREQNYKCCYCQKETLSSHGRVWDVEHIVPKSTHPHFLFEPENLAVSCVDCNSAKGDTRVLSNNSVVRYPRRSEAFFIVHPHYDNFSSHIKTFGSNFYQAKTRKGENTIAICRLMRYGYEFMDWDSELAGHESLVDTVFELLGAKDSAKRSQCLSQLRSILDQESVRQTSSDEISLDVLEQADVSIRSAEVA